jgi:hypothetical protein
VTGVVSSVPRKAGFWAATHIRRCAGEQSRHGASSAASWAIGIEVTVERKRFLASVDAGESEQVKRQRSVTIKQQNG